jgi:hypothetical protein
VYAAKYLVLAVGGLGEIKNAQGKITDLCGVLELHGCFTIRSTVLPAFGTAIVDREMLLGQGSPTQGQAIHSATVAMLNWDSD